MKNGTREPGSLRRGRIDVDQVAIASEPVEDGLLRRQLNGSRFVLHRPAAALRLCLHPWRGGREAALTRQGNGVGGGEIVTVAHYVQDRGSSRVADRFDMAGDFEFAGGREGSAHRQGLRPV